MGNKILPYFYLKRMVKTCTLVCFIAISCILDSAEEKWRHTLFNMAIYFWVLEKQVSVWLLKIILGAFMLLFYNCGREDGSVETCGLGQGEEKKW